MNKRLNYLMLIFTMVLLVCRVNAQTDVKIMDLTIKPLQHSGNQSDSVTLDVQFKLSNVKKAAKATLGLGTAKDKLNVFVAQPVFNTEGPTTTLTYNNVSAVVNGFQVAFQVKLSNQQYNNYTTATLFVETTNGETTTHIYHQK